VSDNVIASGNSQTAINLFLLGKYFLNPSYTNTSENMVKKVQKNILQHGQYHANWARLLVLMDKPFHEIVVIGKDAEQVVEKLHELPSFNFLVAATASVKEPDIPLLKDKKPVNGLTTIYSCRNGICSTPTNELDVVLKNIQ
jgi:hypothetical protein